MLGMVDNCVYKQVAWPKDKLLVGTKMLYKRKIGQAGNSSRSISADLTLKGSGR